MPYWLEVILWVVGINWIAPFLIWIYPLSVKLIWRDFVWEGWHGPFGKFRLAWKDLEPWHVKLWKDWGGVGLYFFMCYRDNPGPADDKWVERAVKHESEHCKHWVWFGLCFYLFYILHSVWIWVTQKIKGKPYTKHAYLDNWSERLARKKAGQVVDIDPKDWPHGKGDLWPWF